MTTTSSARPARLEAFEELSHQLCDGLRRRAGQLEDAFAAYQHGCDDRFDISTHGLAAQVRGWARELDELARWTGDVGHAFRISDSIGAYVDQLSEVGGDSVQHADTHWLAGRLSPEFRDRPFLGVGPNAARNHRPWRRPGAAGRPTEPALWVGELNRTNDLIGDIDYATDLALASGTPPITVAPWTGRVTFHQFGDDLTLGLADAVGRGLIPAELVPLIRASRWLGPVTNGIDGALGFQSQWRLDADRPTGDRAWRSFVRGGLEGGGSALGGYIGGTLIGATVCAPFGPVAALCAVVGGVIGGVAGQRAGDEAADATLEEDEPEPVDPADEIAEDDDEVGAGITDGFAADAQTLATELPDPPIDLGLDADEPPPLLEGLPDREPMPGFGPPSGRRR